jgi:hypothetical protein
VQVVDYNRTVSTYKTEFVIVTAVRTSDVISHFYDIQGLAKLSSRIRKVLAILSGRLPPRRYVLLAF